MADSYKFSIQDKVYQIPKDKIKPGTLLYTIVNTKVGIEAKYVDGIYVFDPEKVNKDMFDIVYDFLMHKKCPDIDDSDVLDYFLIDTNTYEYALHRENYFRENMYNPEFKNGPMETNMYYDLIKIDENAWKEIIKGMSDISDDVNLLFNSKKIAPKLKSWNLVLESLSNLNYPYDVLNGKYDHDYKSKGDKRIKVEYEKEYLDTL